MTSILRSLKVSAQIFISFDKHVLKTPQSSVYEKNFWQSYVK